MEFRLVRCYPTRPNKQQQITQPIFFSTQIPAVHRRYAFVVGHVVVQINRVTVQSRDINLVMYDCYRRWRYCRIWNMLPALFFPRAIHLSFCYVIYLCFFFSPSRYSLPFFLFIQFFHSLTTHFFFNFSYLSMLNCAVYFF